MTAICYADGIIATDSLASGHTSTIRHYYKDKVCLISIPKGNQNWDREKDGKKAVFCYTGSSVDHFKFLDWFYGKVEWPFEGAEERSGCFVVISPKNAYWWHKSQDGYRDSVPLENFDSFAWASGHQFQEGAMRSGCSAVDAVKLSVHNEITGIGGDIVSVNVRTQEFFRHKIKPTTWQKPVKIKPIKTFD